MIMKLEQKQGLKRRSFEVFGDKLKVVYKTTSETKEWTVEIESVGHNTLIEKQSRVAGIITGMLFLAFGIFMLAAYLADKEKSLALWAVIAIILFYLFLGLLILAFPVKREIHLTGGMTQLTFFVDSPSKEEVNKFIEYLINTSKKLLLEKYAKIDIDLPEDTMLNQLNWLRNRNLLSEKEYSKLKNEYKTRKIINK